MQALAAVLVGGMLTSVFLIAIPWSILHYLDPAAGTHGLPPLRLGGIALIGFGVYLYVWSVRRLLARNTSAIPGRTPNTLETDGWYARVRHPLLLGVVAVLLGEAAAFASLPLLAYALLYWLWLHLFVTLREERDLRDAFGADYDAYARTVPRWLPRPW